MPSEVVLATHNEGKLAELRALLAPLSAKLRALSEFDAGAAEENAPSFVENALLKARHAARVSGLPAIADDSGLLVAALDDAPGVRSARYAGEDASDADNNQALLRALKGVPEGKRTARYVCVLVYLRSAEDPTPVIAHGTWRGVIAANPRGANGFGYDPLFYVPELKHTVAELDAATKNHYSHRAKAAKHLLSLLHEYAAQA
ncbi:MAG: RdgB/HAM1 family non-canonical purine NTP pyrophosphatase [Sinobacteraceae bacterium]|nr:RdgB/HAM1 family non-canonical purine NTP pyrophosphatase [Nevskiaceae bacterium]